MKQSNTLDRTKVVSYFFEEFFGLRNGNECFTDEKVQLGAEVEKCVVLTLYDTDKRNVLLQPHRVRHVTIELYSDVHGCAF